MPVKKLLRLVFQNIARSKKNFIFSSIGIIVGISTFTFFIALSQGVKDRVLNRIFPIDQLEVEPLGGVSSAGGDAEQEGGLGDVLAARPRSLDANAVKQLESIAGVTRAYPKMRARFPAKVETGVLDRRVAGEGFLEGLEISDTVLNEMRANESRCSDTSEDICQRREVSCMANRDCPHQGLECTEGRCVPRQYWRSFVDRHSRPQCSSQSDCRASQVCAYDRWVILRTASKNHVFTIRSAVAGIEHPRLDVDLYVAVAGATRVTKKDVADAERVSGEIWSVGQSVTPEARSLLPKTGVTLREFGTVDEALAHVNSLAATLKEGTCAGTPCRLDKAEKEIGSWKYFLHYENHRGDCDRGNYCAARNVLRRQGRCEPYMPVALNPLMIDFYNSNVVSQLGTQPLPNPCLVLGLKGYFRLGFSFLRKSREAVWQHVRWAEIVGFTDKAMHLGGTVPLDYVKRYNRFFLGAESIKSFDSVLLQIPRNELVAEVIEAIEKQSFDLSRSSKFARKAGEMLMIITLAFLLISLTIIVISAMNISHTFLMVVFERQREIGVMRALGATRWDIRKIILVESGLIGLAAGVVGNLASYTASRVVNLLAETLRDRFPLIPEDFFVYGWPLVLGSILFALVFCLLGAWVPANRAAKLDPAVVLTQA